MTVGDSGEGTGTICRNGPEGALDPQQRVPVPFLPSPVLCTPCSVLPAPYSVLRTASPPPVWPPPPHLSPLKTSAGRRPGTRRLCFSITPCGGKSCVMLKHNQRLSLAPDRLLDGVPRVHPVSGPGALWAGLTRWPDEVHINPCPPLPGLTVAPASVPPPSVN